MRRSVLLIIIFTLFYTGQAAAQEEPADIPGNNKLFTLGIGIGYSFIGYREETDLPLNRYINSLFIALEGRIERDNFLYLSNIGFFYGKNNEMEIAVDEDFFTFYQKKSESFKLFLESALDYKLWGSSNFPGYLGGAFRGNVYINHLPQTVYFGMTAVVSINLHVTQKWIINPGNFFIFSASVPVFGYAVRPPYYGLLYSPLDMDNRITSFHNYLAVFGDLKYQYKLNTLPAVSDIFLYAGFGFELSRISFPQPRNDALIRINGGLICSF